jgi:hypothetical protein
MIKALKLILIAIVVLGAVVGLLFLSGGDASTGIKPDTSRQITLLQEKIDSEWSATDEWDTSLLTGDLDMLKQYSKDLGDGYRTLVDHVGIKASERLVKVVNEEFAKTDCDANKIERYSNGLDILLAKIPSYKHDAKVQQLQGTVTLYRDIRRLGKGGMLVAPNYKFENDSWANFNAYSQRIVSLRNSYRQSPYFQYISHITEVKNSLNGVEGRIGQARKLFKKALTEQIIKAYSPKNPDLAPRLHELHSRYVRELGNEGTLDNFVQNY